MEGLSKKAKGLMATNSSVVVVGGVEYKGINDNGKNTIKINKK